MFSILSLIGSGSESESSSYRLFDIALRKFDKEDKKDRKEIKTLEHLPVDTKRVFPENLKTDVPLKQVPINKTGSSAGERDAVISGMVIPAFPGSIECISLLSLIC